VNRVRLVTRREIVTQARSKAFMIGTGVMVLVAFAATALPGLLSRGDEDGDDATKIAAVGDLADQLGGLEGFEVVAADSRAEAERAVRDGSVEAAVAVGGQGGAAGGLEVIAEDEAPASLVAALTLVPKVTLLDPPKVNELVRQVAPAVLAVVFFMVVMMYGQVAAQNTVVEKQTRVIEILLATVPARVLLAGKILSNAVLALATVAALLLAGGLGLAVGGGLKSLTDPGSGLARALGGVPLGELGGSLAWFMIFFMVAFVLFSSLMVGSAATVSRLEEVSSVLTPTMILAMVPYMIIMTPLGRSQTVLGWLSYIPFSSPIAMPVRLILGDTAWWEALASLIILVVTTGLAIALAGKLYENSILRTGARVKFADALKSAG
jgi:ABC-2 type transport system permease protein